MHDRQGSLNGNTRLPGLTYGMYLICISGNTDCIALCRLQQSKWWGSPCRSGFVQASCLKSVYKPRALGLASWATWGTKVPMSFPKIQPNAGACRCLSAGVGRGASRAHPSLSWSSILLMHAARQWHGPLLCAHLRVPYKSLHVAGMNPCKVRRMPVRIPVLPHRLLQAYGQIRYAASCMASAKFSIVQVQWLYACGCMTQA